MALRRRVTGAAARSRTDGLTLFLAGVAVGAVVLWVALSALSPRPWTRSTATLDPVHTPPAEFQWTQAPPAHFPLPPYARFLADVTIVLDPGHVGQRDPGGTWKRGPTGLREAEVNLRVAHFLRQFLLAAGADVHLTRVQDVSLDLPDAEDLRRRATLANELQADLFVSIHHNGADNPMANYTTVYYHGDDGGSPASLCAARYVSDGLEDALRLEKHVACALRSDFLHYPGEGFAVLRYVDGPAILTEASFHSNPQEEQRLRNPAYNRREAYGLFLGLARWARAGLPRVNVKSPADKAVRAGNDVVVSLDDGLQGRRDWGADALRIRPDSVVVKLDGRRLNPRLSLDRQELRVSIPRHTRGQCELWVDFENVYGQHVLYPAVRLDVHGR